MRRHPKSIHRAILAGTEGPDHTYKLPSNIQKHLEDLAAVIKAAGVRPIKLHGLSPAKYFSGAWPAIQLAFVSRSSVGTMPTVSPLGPTSRTSGTRIRSLMRSSVLMCPPVTQWLG